VLLHAGVAAAAASTPQGAVLLAGPGGMPPCKRCGGGASKVHSRDDLLAMEDGELRRMQDSLTKEVEVLDTDLEAQKKDHDDEIGKLHKRLSEANSAYKKFGKETAARSNKFAKTKAKASKDLDGSLDSTLQANNDIAKLHSSMHELRKAVNPVVDKFISGKGWPHGCSFTAKAKALLQQLEASLQMVDLSDAAEAAPVRRGEALLRRSAKTSKPADQDKYKLVRAVQQLEEKRSKLTEEKGQDMANYGQQQRITLDRIDVAKIKSRLKATTEQKYEESDVSLEKNLKNQVQAAGDYLDSAKTQLARATKDEAAASKLFESFKAELKKSKCL